MVAMTFKITNEFGLHARPAVQFVKIATQFKSEIKVVNADIEANGKSIMGVMMLAAAKGTEITIQAEGVDETEAVNALGELVTRGFGEY